MYSTETSNRNTLDARNGCYRPRVPATSVQRLLVALILVMAALLCAPQVAPGVVVMSAPETASGDFLASFGDSVRPIESQPPERHQVISSSSTTPGLEVARWLSRDPQGESGGLNLYGFVGNDPVNRWDYLGLNPFTDPDSWINQAWGGVVDAKAKVFDKAVAVAAGPAVWIGFGGIDEVEKSFNQTGFRNSLVNAERNAIINFGSIENARNTVGGTVYNIQKYGGETLIDLADLGSKASPTRLLLDQTGVDVFGSLKEANTAQAEQKLSLFEFAAGDVDRSSSQFEDSKVYAVVVVEGTAMLIPGSQLKHLGKVDDFRLLGKIDGGAIDPVLDAAHIIDANKFRLAGTDFPHTRLAYNVISDSRTQWVVPREMMGEVIKGTKSLSEAKELIRWLKSNQASVMSRSQAGQLRGTSEFKAFSKWAANSPKHTIDLAGAGYARALGIPFIGDNRFVRWSRETIGVSKSLPTPIDHIFNMVEFGKTLGY